LRALHSDYLIKHDLFHYSVHNCNIYVQENFIVTLLFDANIITINITTYYRIPVTGIRNDSEDDDTEDTAGVIYSLVAVVPTGAMTDQFRVNLPFSCPLLFTDGAT
jgi:hypothetical protein